MIGFNGGLIGKDRTTSVALAVGVWTLGEQIKARRTNVWPLASVKLLDSFPNASAAYSLRLLRSAYTGSLVTVRRASDDTTQGFTEVQINDGSLAAFCGVGNGFVTTWHDQSGNANNATQATFANQPQIISAGALILDNGKPVVKFNGSSHNLVQTANSSISQPFTVIISCKRTAATGGNQDLFRSPSSGAVHFLNSSDSWNLYGYAGVTTKLGTTAISTTFLSSVVYNGSSSINSFNNSETTIDLGTDPLTASNALTIGSNAGAGSFAAIDMQELVFYGSSQASNFTGINSNINAFYGIY